LVDEERKDEQTYDEKIVSYVHKLKRVIAKRTEEVAVQIQDLT
jgi:hypothetical protein